MRIGTSVSEGVDGGSPEPSTGPWCGLFWELDRLARCQPLLSWQLESPDKRYIDSNERTLILKKCVSILGFTFSKLVLGGIMPFSSTSTALRRPARPLAPSRWPMLDLRAPLYPKNQHSVSRALCGAV